VPSESPNEGAFNTYGTNEEVIGAPEYMAPIMDRPIPYIPYRGTEFHGVAPQEIPVVDDENKPPDGTVLTGIFQPPEEDVNPVPVRVVDTATHEYKQWRAWQAFASAAQPSMVANRKEGQSGLNVKNCSASSRVWLGPDPSVSIYTGYPLDGGGEVSFTGEAPVYAIADTGVAGNVTLAVLSQFSTAQ